MAPVPGGTLRCPARVDTGFAIGSMLRLQVPRVRMADGWALGKFGGEFGYRLCKPEICPQLSALMKHLLRQIESP